MTSVVVAAELEHMEVQQQQQFSSSDGVSVNNRWDADDWDNENSSARLFERSRIKALAGDPRPSSPLRGLSPSLSPGFSSTAAFNYNQLEGRFKQLQ
ncbi:hypothetical protein JOQ06_013876, partial [Pogonophryne albipinna]